MACEPYVTADQLPPILQHVSLRGFVVGTTSLPNTSHDLPGCQANLTRRRNSDDLYNGGDGNLSLQGMLCHPYLSLQYYDILQDANVRGFAVGATNVLFKQKRHLLDAVIQVR